MRRQWPALAAECEAANVRLRAERRAGELLKDLARADLKETGKAARDKQLEMSTAAKTPSNEPSPLLPTSPYAEALKQNGISRHTAHRFQELARIPKNQIDAALAVPIWDHQPEFGRKRTLGAALVRRIRN